MIDKEHAAACWRQTLAARRLKSANEELMAAERENREARELVERLEAGFQTDRGEKHGP